MLPSPWFERKIGMDDFRSALKSRTLKKALVCRAFETVVFEKVNEGEISIPVYLSAGQELIPAVISTFLEMSGFNTPSSRQVFIQHRGHSTYLCFGGCPKQLIWELLGSQKGCASGYGGSASIQSVEANVFGHDGLMGSHGPIATGMCFANKKLTICFTGDAAVEEDYFLTSIGWAATKQLPIMYVVEDNNLSILTEKAVRRCWEMADVASSMGCYSLGIEDSFDDLADCLSSMDLAKPALLNVNTTRLWWHAGSGVDDPHSFDRLKFELGEELFNTQLEQELAQMRKLWVECENQL